MTHLPVALEEAQRWRHSVASVHSSQASLRFLGLDVISDVAQARASLAEGCLFDIEPIARVDEDWIIGIRSRDGVARVEIVHVPSGEASLFSSGISELMAALVAFGPRPRDDDAVAELVAAAPQWRTATEEITKACGGTIAIGEWLDWVQADARKPPGRGLKAWLTRKSAPHKSPLSAWARAAEGLRRLGGDRDLSLFLDLQARMSDDLQALSEVEVDASACDVGPWSSIARLHYCTTHFDNNPPELEIWRAEAFLRAITDDAGWAYEEHVDSGLGISALGIRIAIAKSVFEEGAPIGEAAAPVLDAWRAAVENETTYNGLAHLEATSGLLSAGRFGDAWAAARTGWAFARARGGIPSALRQGIAALARECHLDPETIARVEAFSES